MRSKLILIILVSVLLFLVGCEVGTGRQEGEIDTSGGFVGYVVKIEENRMLVVSPEAEDYSSTGGMKNFYSAIWFSQYPSKANIKIGSKVAVWAEGGKILESYPAQGTVERVSIITKESPKGAKLTEAEAIERAIHSMELPENEFAVVKEATYDPSASLWSISLVDDNREDIIRVQVDDNKA